MRLSWRQLIASLCVHTTDIHQSGGSNAVLSRPQFKEARSSLEFSTNLGISPRKITELRIKKLQEVRELQQLLEQKVLTEEEFSEQKSHGTKLPAQTRTLIQLLHSNEQVKKNHVMIILIILTLYV